MDQINIFSPFRHRPDTHEDRLTWGFLVALTYAPVLQRLLRRLVLKDVPEDRWPHQSSWHPAAISTQTSRLTTEAEFVVSVLLSDTRLEEPVGVEPSPRGARYDGVVEYPDGLVLIIENKPQRSHVWKGQLSPSLASLDALPDDAEVDVFERAVSLEWADVLEAILSYADSPVASYTERSLTSDFVSFAVDLHPKLSPYRTFELCGTRREALSKRVSDLLSSIARGLGFDLGIRPGSGPHLELPNEAVRQLHVSVAGSDNGDGLVLRTSIWPGDTTRQARAFLSKVDAEAFLQLAEAGWQIATNLHFSHFQKHLVWAHPTLSIREYLAFFQANPGEIGRTRFDDVDLEELIRRWRGFGLISGRDEAELREKFGKTRRGYINLVPGFGVTREWPMSSIIELEADQRLEETLLGALRVCLATWNESIPPGEAT